VFGSRFFLNKYINWNLVENPIFVATELVLYGILVYVANNKSRRKFDVLTWVALPTSPTTTLILTHSYDRTFHTEFVISYIHYSVYAPVMLTRPGGSRPRPRPRPQQARPRPRPRPPQTRPRPRPRP